VQYIAARLRHGDEAGCVQVGSYSERTDADADDIPTLYLRLSEAEEPFYTKIYYAHNLRSAVMRIFSQSIVFCMNHTL